MKLILAFLLLATMSVAAFAQDGDAGHTAAAVDTFGASMSKANMSKVDELFADKATVYWVDKKLYGKPDLMKFLRHQLASVNKYEMSFSPDDGLEDNNISTGWGTFAINYGTSDGQISNQILGRYTVVMKNVEDKWQIVSLHLSIQK
jgi:hypothetical protein